MNYILFPFICEALRTMCLKNIKYQPIQHGFKVGRVLNGGFSAFLTDPNHHMYDTSINLQPTKFDEWEYATLVDVFFSRDEKTYKSGFHICPSLQIAQEYLSELKRKYYMLYTDWTIFPCEYNGVLAVGQDESGIETVIAVAIKISSTPIS